MGMKELLLSLGYDEESTKKIMEDYSLKNCSNHTLKNRIEKNFLYLTSIGYAKGEIIRITKKLPGIFAYSIKNIKQKIEDMINLGYTKEEFIKMTKIFPAIYSLSIENIKQKIEDMENLGYTKEDVLKMTKLLPPVYGLSIENIRQKIEDMENLGYTREDVLKITKCYPALYSYSIENIRQKIEDMENLGYTREEVIEMTKSLPPLYGYSIENIRQKIEFYDSVQMHDLAILNPKYLMQSISLSYARYQFYLDKGIVIGINNYRKLFVRNKQFEKSYGITKEELLEKYNYEKDMEKQNGRNI